MKPAAYRIFRNNRWTYNDAPNIRKEERAAWQPLYSDMDVQEMEARIRAEEREACAKVCDSIHHGYDTAHGLADTCAAAIRARGTDAPHSS
jgi:hypothetical protein